MARPSLDLTILLFISPVILAMVTSSYPCPYTCENEIDLRLYLLQVDSGTGKNQFGIYKSNMSDFGQTIVDDWTIVDAPALGAKVIGHAQGVHIMSDLSRVGWFVSFNLVFQGDRFNGSTLQVMGVLPPEGEWSIVGGTGELAMARGTIKYRVAQPPPPPGSPFAIRQLDIHVLFPNKFTNCYGDVIVASAQDK